MRVFEESCLLKYLHTQLSESSNLQILKKKLHASLITFFEISGDVNSVGIESRA